MRTRKMPKYFIGGENQTTIERLCAGETVIVKGKGNSMTPKLKSGEAVIVEPITDQTKIKKLFFIYICFWYLHLLSV